MLKLLNKLYQSISLDEKEAEELLLSFLSESADPICVSAALVALKIKGETPEEIAGAARAMIAKATPFQTGNNETLDTCGTGGDGYSTVNISTASALIAAEAGCPVVKHGNRSVSSRSGSADILEQLGIPLNLSIGGQKKCLDKAGICFLFAPAFHPAVKYVMPIRRNLKTRTIFNILGPLVNPARPAYQVLGVYAKELCDPVAKTLLKLGTKRALVVHGSGLDELTLHDTTHAVYLNDGTLEERTFHPSDFGFPTSSLESIRGGSPEENADWLRMLLKGKGSDVHKQAVAMNAGAGIWVAGKSSTIHEGIQMSLDILNTDRGWNRLSTWLEAAHGT